MLVRMRRSHQLPRVFLRFEMSEPYQGLLPTFPVDYHSIGILMFFGVHVSLLLAITASPLIRRARLPLTWKRLHLGLACFLSYEDATRCVGIDDALQVSVIAVLPFSDMRLLS